MKPKSFTWNSKNFVEKKTYKKVAFVSSCVNISTVRNESVNKFFILEIEKKDKKLIDTTCRVGYNSYTQLGQRTKLCTTQKN